MSIREKLLKVKQQTLYKLQTPNVLRDEHITNNSKDWLNKGIDITDYFNYGFNDATLRLFIQKLSKSTDMNVGKLQKEYSAIAAKSKLKPLILKDNIPLDYGGLGVVSTQECLPEEVVTLKEVLFMESIDFEGEILYLNETILDIFRHYKKYLEDQVAKNELFDFNAVFTNFNKQSTNWKEFEKLFMKDGNSEKKKQKHEKKKSKKEKKQKKEKKKKHKKKHSQHESIEIVPLQIVVQDESNPKMECELILDSVSDQLSKQEQPQLSTPSPLQEPPQKENSPPPPPPPEPIRQRNHNWPRNLIHGILQGNKNQQRR